MNDTELLREVAKLWVANGGDVDGLAWCYGALKEAIRLEIEGTASNEEGIEP